MNRLPPQGEAHSDAPRMQFDALITHRHHHYRLTIRQLSVGWSCTDWLTYPNTGETIAETIDGAINRWLKTHTV